MKKIEQFFRKMNGKFSAIRVLNAIALFLAIDSVSTCCIWIHHQPKVPKSLDKYIKYK